MFVLGAPLANGVYYTVCVSSNHPHTRAHTQGVYEISVYQCTFTSHYKCSK